MDIPPTISSTEMVDRLKVLDELDKYIDTCQTDITQLLDTLGWTPEHFLQSRNLVQCPFSGDHRVPKTSLETHTAICKLRQQGYTKEQAEMILEDRSYFYKEASCVYTARLDKQSLNTVLWNHHVQNQSVFYPYEKMPLTMEEEEQLLSREDRLGLTEYIIKCAKEANRLKELGRDELLVSENLADLIKKDDEERKLDPVEEMAALRDYRRRRQSYRAKNVHITKKSHTEIMREVITNQMEMYAKSLSMNDQDEEVSGEMGSTQTDVEDQVEEGELTSKELSSDHGNDKNRTYRRDGSQQPGYSDRRSGATRSRGGSRERDRGREGRRGRWGAESPDRYRNDGRDASRESSRYRDRSKERSHERSQNRDKSRERSQGQDRNKERTREISDGKDRNRERSIERGRRKGDGDRRRDKDRHSRRSKDRDIGKTKRDHLESRFADGSNYDNGSIEHVHSVKQEPDESGTAQQVASEQSLNAGTAQQVASEQSLNAGTAQQVASEQSLNAGTAQQVASEQSLNAGTAQQVASEQSLNAGTAQQVASEQSMNDNCGDGGRHSHPQTTAARVSPVGKEGSGVKDDDVSQGQTETVGHERAERSSIDTAARGDDIEQCKKKKKKKHKSRSRSRSHSKQREKYHKKHKKHKHRHKQEPESNSED